VYSVGHRQRGRLVGGDGFVGLATEDEICGRDPRLLIARNYAAPSRTVGFSFYTLRRSAFGRPFVSEIIGRRGMRGHRSNVRRKTAEIERKR